MPNITIRHEKEIKKGIPSTEMLHNSFAVVATGHGIVCPGDLVYKTPTSMLCFPERGVWDDVSSKYTVYPVDVVIKVNN